VTASARWDHESWYALASRNVEVTRAAGALTILPVALNTLASLLLSEGDLNAAAALVAEAEAINDVTGSEYVPFARTMLAALRGREPEASALIQATVDDAVASSRGYVARYAGSAAATLHNGSARYEQALAAARDVAAMPPGWSGDLHLHELVEAAARSGQLALAIEATEKLAQTTQTIGTDWSIGVEARCRALVSRPVVAADLYRESIDRLARTPMRVDLARSHLLYGEWLRRANRRVDARVQLRIAHESFLAMGAEAFAERAGSELAATGETVRKRVLHSIEELTAQEARVAHLAAEGRTNAEIGAELFISARTVEYHLRKVYPKLGITSGRELEGALPPQGRIEASA
jgi:DNA-binding CsgD family transcriptional regulator